MFNSFRILNNRKITILGCDNDLKPTYYAGNSFIITECDKHYNLQMLSDINLRCKIFNTYIFFCTPSSNPTIRYYF